jgi:hypothetical protein
MIRFNDPHDAYAIAQSAGAVFNSSVDQCIARVEDGKLMGGVLYQRYTGASIGLHVASFDPLWVNRDMLWVCFHYPFVQLGCKKMFGEVPESNSKALEFDLKLGFKEEARIKDVFPDGDLIVLSMVREDCRWLRLKPRGLQEPSYGW